MKRALLPLVLMVWLAGCQVLPQDESPAWLQENGRATPTPFLPQPNPAGPEFTLGETKAGLIWFDPHLPPALLQAAQLPPGWQTTDQPQNAQVQVKVGADGLQAGRWVYAAVARFATVEDEIDSVTLRKAWYGLDTSLPPLIVEADTLAMLTGWWGVPAEGAVEVVPSGRMSEALWQQPSARGIIPFERLEPRLKVLAVDGISPLARGLDESAYPLALPFGLSGERAAELAGILPPGNRDENKMTVVAVTGVTALVRATALYLRLRGVEHALGEVTDWLREADITHINNEVAFRQGCSPPQEGLNESGVIIFPCSDIRWIELLEAVGTDVVEMTGDHFIDSTPEDVLFTLEEYHRRGWQTYGGGATLAEGWQPALFEHNGNRIAFLGCNAKGPAYAAASPTKPGAVLCDFDRLTDEIRRLRSAGYLPIVTFSHLEYETFAARPRAVEDFERVAEAGAVIVSGSQGHLPQAMQFYGDSFLHYGLGNLFFDQYSLGEPFERAFIDRHIFYDGRYLGVELLTLRFEDFLRSRPMTADERRQLLQVIFEASGW
jgi:poly-gamma-glutamate synthesis protein (capsule biosynthesis protein)